MSPVNEVVQEGLPELFLRDIPVTGKMPVTRPEIYYGEEPEHYVIVKTNGQRVRLPRSAKAASRPSSKARAASTSAPSSSALLFAWEFGDLNIADLRTR